MKEMNELNSARFAGDKEYASGFVPQSSNQPPTSDQGADSDPRPCDKSLSTGGLVGDGEIK